MGPSLYLDIYRSNYCGFSFPLNQMENGAWNSKFPIFRTKILSSNPFSFHWIFWYKFIDYFYIYNPI